MLLLLLFSFFLVSFTFKLYKLVCYRIHTSKPNIFSRKAISFPSKLSRTQHLLNPKRAHNPPCTCTRTSTTTGHCRDPQQVNDDASKPRDHPNRWEVHWIKIESFETWQDETDRLETQRTTNTDRFNALPYAHEFAIDQRDFPSQLRWLLMPRWWCSNQKTQLTETCFETL